MKLNTQYKNDLRTYIVSQIQSKCEKGEFPEGERLKLDKELLTELLFDEKKDENGEPYKELIWNLRGLDKIDLKGISFNGVNWNSSSQIDLSNTNVSINFKKAYKGPDGLVVNHINFENVPLAKANADEIDTANDCDFKGTNINVVFTLTTNKRFTNCDLTGINLETSTISTHQLFALEKDGRVKGFNMTKFKNTGVHIELANMLDHQKAISRMIHDGQLIGCYVNDVFIPNPEQSQQRATDVLSEYQSYVDKYRENIEDAFITLGKTK